MPSMVQYSGSLDPLAVKGWKLPGWAVAGPAPNGRPWPGHRQPMCGASWKLVMRMIHKIKVPRLIRPASNAWLRPKARPE